LKIETAAEILGKWPVAVVDVTQIEIESELE
jgi:hypothetical protein